MAVLDLERIERIVPERNLANTPEPKQKSKFCAIPVTATQEAGMRLIAQRIKEVRLQKRLEAELGLHAASHAVHITKMWLFLHGPLAVNKPLRMLSAIGDMGWEGLIRLMGLDAYDQMMMQACDHLVTHVESPGYTATSDDLAELREAIVTHFGAKAWNAQLWSEYRADPCYPVTEPRY
ncbi:MAG TPA: hypothetical protein VNG90_03210 [Candidatus Acidoferrum sp.]|nr:hypothetical protein [Candidatus Acidoferrum sp.]